MKEFLNFMEKDYQKENFTKREWIVYGIVLPMAIVLLAGVCGFFAGF